MTELLILLYCLPGLAIAFWHLLITPEQPTTRASAEVIVYSLLLVVLWPLWLQARRYQ